MQNAKIQGKALLKPIMDALWALSSLKHKLSQNHKMNQSVEDIAGYLVSTQNVSACVADVVSWVQQVKTAPVCRWLACVNPHSYVLALDDPFFAEALKAADWLIPDGTGIVLASKLLGGKINSRVTGSEIFYGLLTEINQAGGYKVFFLGSSEATLADICRRMAEDYPNVHVAGTYSPPFKPEFSAADNQAMIAAVNNAAADILWVGMTAPKQEKWIYQHHQELNVSFTAAVGAVFDFYSGRVKRSPPVFQRLGLEWLPRLLQQPRRLWRRMGVSAPIFLWHVFRVKVKRNKAANEER